MRRHEPLDPVVERELEELEAALSDAPGADPVLVALARDVRAVAPRPESRARATLDARVEAGFPRAAGPAGGGGAEPRRGRGGGCSCPPAACSRPGWSRSPSR